MMKKPKNIQGGIKSKGVAESNSPYSSVNSSLSSNGSNGSKTGTDMFQSSTSSEIRTIERNRRTHPHDSSSSKKFGAETSMNTSDKITPTKKNKSSEKEPESYISPEYDTSPSSRTVCTSFIHLKHLILITSPLVVQRTTRAKRTCRSIP